MHFLNKNNILDIKNITPCYRWGSILLLFFLCTKNIYAQDSQLSQYYASPLYLNPALVGTSNNGRAFFNYRNQWVNIPSDFATYVFGMDTPLPNKHISIGAQVVKDFIVQNNKSIYNKTIANLTSGYKFNLNRQYVVSFGLQIGFEQLDLNSSSLIFGDQINDNGITSNNTKEKLDRSTSFSPDISAGVLSTVISYGLVWHSIILTSQLLPEIKQIKI
ncbi:type IX secretion system membrane protein PorP/SprF [Flammeovirga kamogawensis]|nr:PorP/SprF family type IX secretion system membrane protein [Flammeovirga kamogawensis]TRX65629.1 type IX secretion system membrane protein PorP/SprF [Flammeovirga kamogawensis]